MRIQAGDVKCDDSLEAISYSEAAVSRWTELLYQLALIGRSDEATAMECKNFVFAALHEACPRTQ